MKVCGRSSRKRLAGCLTPLVVMTLLFYMSQVHHEQISSGDRGGQPVKQAGRKLTAYVVEEHHEALPYWVKAAEQKVIPMHGNILVHIDGHSDQGAPAIVPGMPLFRWPENEQELRTFLQANDVFVNGAVMMGLVSRFIWIYPSWDPTILKTARYSKRELQIGMLSNTVKYPDVPPRLCACMVFQTGIRLCMAMEDGGKEAADGDILNGNKDEEGMEDEEGSEEGNDTEDARIPRGAKAIPEDACDIEKVYTSEYVREDLAAEMLHDREWIAKDSVVILDIDEDYFGCELAGTHLAEAAPTWDYITDLNALVSQFLCPSTAQEEDRADGIMKDLLVLYHKICTWTPDRQQCETDVDTLLASTLDHVRQVWKIHSRLFCPEGDQQRLEEKWKDILHLLHRFDEDLLAALLKTGFCLDTAPITHNFQSVGHFVVCHGSNIPGDTVVFLHSPTDLEVKVRGDQLAGLVHQVGLSQTQLVTVCRSVRDGYTPREQAMDIEGYILQGLQYSGLAADLRVVYDDALLGDSQGWPNRHKRSFTD